MTHNIIIPKVGIVGTVINGQSPGTETRRLKVSSSIMQILSAKSFLGAMILTASLASAQTWNLVWSDEFEVPGLPDPAKWGYDVGGGGYGNNELQYYTDARAENASVANGVLTIKAIKESFGGNNYTSARLVTANKGDWLYGKIEVRAKLPKGRGMWPAIWMLPTDWEYGGWPSSGELDLMENVGYDSTRIHSNIHTQAYNHTIGTNKGNNVTLTDPWYTWHTYRIEWFADSLAYYVDDTRIFSFKKEYTGFTTWPFDKRFHLILNIAVGGNWGGANGVDDSRFPQTMEVDYVRVYQENSGPIVDPIPPPTGELVWNGDFTQAALKWLPVGYFEGAFASGTLDGEEYKVEVTTPGTLDWHVQFSQAGISLEQGKTYHVSFQARSSIDRTIAVAANQNVSPWTTYAKDTVAITTSKAAYSYNFTMTNATDPSARIEFDLGGIASNIWIDDVSITEAGTTTIPKKTLRTHSSTRPVRWFDLLGRH
jgi:beta-glucanase (GH16 family)